MALNPTPSTWLIIGSVLFFALLTAGLTAIVRRYALQKAILDIPNARSSHDLPTPRGGGLALVAAFLTGLIAVEITGFLPASLFWALAGAGSWVALLGCLEDHKGISPAVRLAGHFIGAAWALFWLGGLPPLPMFGSELDLMLFEPALAALYLVWLLNLYNFMDGINGIAAIETITVCLGGVGLWMLSSAEGALWTVPVLLAAVTSGFLIWNFPRAKIFLGDTGSGFLGLVLGIVSIQAGWGAGELFWGWVILLGTFITDATITFLHRAWKREKVYLPHRNHAYQHAAQKYGHLRVTLAYGIVNLFWLLPMAMLVVSGRLGCGLGLIFAYLPLIIAATWFKAGVSPTGRE